MLICQDNSRNQARFLNEQKKRADKTLKFTPGQKKGNPELQVYHFIMVRD